MQRQHLLNFASERSSAISKQRAPNGGPVGHRFRTWCGSGSLIHPEKRDGIRGVPARGALALLTCSHYGTLRVRDQTVRLGKGEAPLRWADFKRRVGKPISEVISKCLEKDRDMRDSSIMELLRALDTVIKLPNRAKPAGWLTKDRRISVVDDRISTASDTLFPET
jgi:hypothetical protein